MSFFTHNRISKRRQAVDRWQRRSSGLRFGRARHVFEESVVARAARDAGVIRPIERPVAPFDPALLAQKGSLFLTRPSLSHYSAQAKNYTGALANCSTG